MVKKQFKYNVGDIVGTASQSEECKQGWRVVYIDYINEQFYIAYCRTSDGRPCEPTNKKYIDGIMYSEKQSFAVKHLKLIESGHSFEF